MMIPIETIQIIRLYHWHMFGSCEYCGEKYVDVSSICFFHVCESNKQTVNVVDV